MGHRSPRRARRTASCRPGSASTAPPAGSRSATAPTAPSSKATTTSSRPGWPGGSVKDAGLHRQGGAPAPPRGGAGGDHVHADRRRPHLVSGRQALHARPRADPDARRRAARRRARAGAPTSRAPAPGPSIGKHILMGYLPPEHAVVGAAARRRVHGRALPGDGRGRRLDAALRPRELARMLASHEHPRVRQAGAADRRQDRADRRRAGDLDAPPRLHGQPARGVRRRGGGAAGRAARRRPRPC